MPATSKVTAAVWGPLEKYIITGHEKGELIAWDVKVIDNGSPVFIHVCFYCHKNSVLEKRLRCID